MTETVRNVVDMLDEQPTVDRTEVYERLWALAGSLRGRFDERFELAIDPSCEPLEAYGATDRGARGSLRTYAGPELDWFVHSWVGDPEQSFTNIHVTGWLGPQVAVPHIGFAFGTLPRLWFMIEYMPRSDLSVDLAALDAYYAPVNERWLEVRADPRFTYFVSRSLYVRQVMSETSFVFTCDETDENLAFIEQLSHEQLTQWLGWLDEAPPVPVGEREAMAARDLLVRRTTSERDPANVIAERFFGEELTAELVGQLWGHRRVLPRPHEWRPGGVG